MLRVLVADQFPLVRQALRTLVESCFGLSVSGEAETGDAALEHIRQNGCDAAVLDLDLQGIDGVEVLRRTKAERPHFPILMTGAAMDGQLVARLLALGATGCVTKTDTASRFAEGLQALSEGKRYVSGLAGSALAQHLAMQGDRLPGRAPLSTREIQVVRAISGGKTRREIADQLAVTPATISTYRRRVTTKLGLRTDADLTMYALQKGLLSSSRHGAD